MKVRRAVLAGGLALALVALGGCGGDSSGDDGAGGSAKAAQVFKVGDTAKLGDAEIIVHGVKDPFDSGNPVARPPAGFRQVAVDAEVKNLSSKPRVFSGFSQFDLKDSTNKTFTAVPSPRQVPTIGGEAAPGAALRGMVVFQIPEASTGLQLVFKTPNLAEGSVTYNLS